MFPCEQIKNDFLELLVDLNDKVTSGQKVAIQRNFFGDVVAEYTAHVAGKIATIARDALSEPGARVLEILYDSTAPKDNAGISHEPGDDY